MFRKMVYLMCITLVVALLGGTADADIIVAENLLVDLRAEDLTEGAPVTLWPNHGTLGGNFVAGQAGAPMVVEYVEGAKAVTLNGGDWFDGPISPDGIEGAGTRSIEIWVYNPSIPEEETTVAWGIRGGPDGTNMSFNYGNHATWGAAGHWGGHDMAWQGSYAPAPAANNWWNLVYTYDGATVNIYVNGNVGSSAPRALNTHPDHLIKVGTQNAENTGDSPSGHYFTGSIALVRIHDGVLSQSDIINNLQYSPIVRASQPVPPDGSNVAPLYDAPPNVYLILEFTPGAGATTHTAYFSDIEQDVIDRDPDHSLGSDPPWPLYSETAFVVGYDDPGIPEYARAPLVPGTTYYWCIDESGGAQPQPGEVWSFTAMAEKAWGPSPHDGEQYVLTDVTMTWNLGDIDPKGKTLKYDVYIGTSEAAVAGATTDSGEYMGTVTTESYNATGLAGDTEHFWRIDQVLQKNSPPFTREVVPGPGEVWNFTTILEVPIQDPNLIGWWKLNGDTGPAIAFDSSGYKNHGTVLGAPTYNPGHEDNALDFDGFDDYVDLPIGDDIAALGSSTFATWVNFSNTGGAWQRIFDFGSGTTAYLFLTPRLGTNGPMRFAITIGGGGDPEQIVSAPDTLPTGWHHVAVTIDAPSTTAALYLDGDVVGTNTAVTLTPSDLGSPTQNWLGRSQYAADGYYNGAIDDFRIYNKTLSLKDIKILAGLLGASDPDPENGAIDVSRTPTLAWSPGVFAAAVNGNKVYYGANQSAVINRTAPSATVTDPSFPVPTTLNLGDVMYWAVDTVNGVDVWPGDLWSFTTVNWIPVDDMESYTPWTVPGNNIFEAWRDGRGNCIAGNGNETGSTLTENADMTYVLGGLQSMKYEFDNDGTVYSVCTMTQISIPHMYSRIEAQVAGLASGIGTDWTIEGVKALRINFMGQAGNSTTDSFWVQLQDSSKTYGTKVYYGDYEGEDLADMDDPSWHQWDIDLADFSVDLENVVSIVIGIGDEDATSPGGSGTVYIDDIRLYTPRCVPNRSSTAFAALDYTGPGGLPDCLVDYHELEAMSLDWLIGGDFTASPLVARWELNGTYADSSGNGNDGTPVGAGMVFSADAQRGTVLTLAGTGDYVACGDVGISGAQPRTIAGWAKADSATIGDWTNVFGFTGPSGDGGHFDIEIVGETDSTTAGYFGLHMHGDEYDILANDTTWHHFAAIWDGKDLSLYADGSLINTVVPAVALITPDNVHIGKREDNANTFPGSIDDICIFDRALTGSEIVTVMNGGAGTFGPEYHPVPSPANIIDPEAMHNRKVNLLDYAELLKNWLATEMWPQ